MADRAVSYGFGEAYLEIHANVASSSAGAHRVGDPPEKNVFCGEGPQGAQDPYSGAGLCGNGGPERVETLARESDGMGGRALGIMRPWPRTWIAWGC